MLSEKTREKDGRSEITGKRVLVIGAGRSGIGSVYLLNRVGAFPVLLEQSTKTDAAGIREKLDEADRDQTTVITGELPEDVFLSVEAVVPSPGVPMDIPLLARFRERQVPVLSEVELAYRFMKGKLIAITGTNGKTTTTSLVGEILKQTRRKGEGEVFVLGNIGESFARHALETKEDSVTVAEISSFALEGTDYFRADVSAILNITPDHLDRHHTMEEYVRVKERIAKRPENRNGQDVRDSVCVLNYEDPYLRAFGERLEKETDGGNRVFVRWFSSGRQPREARFKPDGDMILALKEPVQDAPGGPAEYVPLLSLSGCRLKGTCNAENILAALNICLAAGVEPSRAAEVIRTFKPVAHRIEYIATKGGVDWYNDSKATNPDSAIQGIRAMDRPTVLIGGGYDKNSDYDAWTALFAGRVKELVLVGETAGAIEESARKNGFTKIYRAQTFEEALLRCAKTAQAGDAVLLSPACASWGMFKDYEERGECFRKFAGSLAD